MSSYRLFKNALPLKEALKDRLSLLSYYYRGSLRKKISKKYVAIPISKYVRLRNIPLRQFILQYKRNVHLKNFVEILKLLNNSINLYKDKKSLWFFCYKKLINKKSIKKMNLLYYKLLSPNNIANHFYYFKRIYNYNVYKNNIGYKNKIPTYN